MLIDQLKYLELKQNVINRWKLIGAIRADSKKV